MKNACEGMVPFHARNVEQTISATSTSATGSLSIRSPVYPRIIPRMHVSEDEWILPQKEHCMWKKFPSESQHL